MLSSIPINEYDAAIRIGVSVSLLRKWRKEKKGPRYFRYGKLIRYREVEIEAFIQSKAVDGGDDHHRP